MGAHALDDVADHQRHHLDHGHQAHSGAAGQIGVDHRDHPPVARVQGGQGEYRPRVAGVVAAVQGVQVDHRAGDRRVVVVVLVRGQAEHRVAAPVEQLRPRGPGPEQLPGGEELLLDEQGRGLGQLSAEQAAVRRRDHGVRVLLHGAAVPVADLPLEHLARADKGVGRVQTLPPVDTHVLKEGNAAPPGYAVVAEMAEQGAGPPAGEGAEQGGRALAQAVVEQADAAVGPEGFAHGGAGAPVDVVVVHGAPLLFTRRWAGRPGACAR